MIRSVDFKRKTGNASAMGLPYRALTENREEQFSWRDAHEATGKEIPSDPVTPVADERTATQDPHTSEGEPARQPKQIDGFGNVSPIIHGNGSQVRH